MKTIKRFEVRSSRVSVSEGKDIYNRQISRPGVIASIVRQFTNGLDQECFYVFMLDAKNKIIGYSEVGRGGIEDCGVDPRIVFRSAIHLSASSIIISHNHPSGDSTPSEADHGVTQRLYKCGKMLGVDLLDHIVVSENNMTSYLESHKSYLR